MTSPRVDKVNFSLTVLVLLGLAIPLLLAPAWTADILQTAYGWITRSFGWFYVLTGALAVIIVLYIGLSRYGQVRLGDVPDLDDQLILRIVEQSDAQAAGRSVSELEAERDANPVALLKALRSENAAAGAFLNQLAANDD